MAGVIVLAAAEDADHARAAVKAMRPHGVRAKPFRIEPVDDLGKWATRAREAIERADAVVVLWSVAGASSPALLAAAAEADALNKIVHARIGSFFDTKELPKPFTGVTALDAGLVAGFTKDPAEVAAAREQLSGTVSEQVSSASIPAAANDPEKTALDVKAPDSARTISDDEMTAAPAGWSWPGFPVVEAAEERRKTAHRDALVRLRQETDPEIDAAMILYASQETRTDGLLALWAAAKKAKRVEVWRDLGAVAFPRLPLTATAAYHAGKARENELVAIMGPGRMALPKGVAMPATPATVARGGARAVSAGMTLSVLAGALALSAATDSGPADATSPTLPVSAPLSPWAFLSPAMVRGVDVLAPAALPVRVDREPSRMPLVASPDLMARAFGPDRVEARSSDPAPRLLLATLSPLDEPASDPGVEPVGEPGTGLEPEPIEVVTPADPVPDPEPAAQPVELEPAPAVSVRTPTPIIVEEPAPDPAPEPESDAVVTPVDAPAALEPDTAGDAEPVAAPVPAPAPSQPVTPEPAAPEPTPRPDPVANPEPVEPTRPPARRIVREEGVESETGAPPRPVSQLPPPRVAGLNGAGARRTAANCPGPDRLVLRTATRGDTLTKLAAECYRDRSAACAIYNATPQLRTGRRDPDCVRPGDMIFLPALNDMERACNGVVFDGYCPEGEDRG